MDLWLRDGVLWIEGEVGAEGAAALREALAGAGVEVVELDGLELRDGVATAEAVNGVRALLAARGRLELRHAPQMLAHTLYKVGDLGREGLVLVAPRIDEGLGAG